MLAPFTFDSRLNTQYLEILYEGNIDYAADLFEIYITEYPAVMEEAREAILSEDYKKKRSYVHEKMVGFPMVGLMHMEEMRYDLEKLIREGKTSEAHQKFATLYEAFHQTLPIIQEEYKRLKDFMEQYSQS